MNFIQRSDINGMIDLGVFPGTVNWLGGDEEARFRENTKKQPDVMAVWQNQTFNYTLNSQGFRAPEFHDVDWASSVVMLGCSIVLGEGLDNTQCLPYQLSEIIGRPVINLGISGAGPDLIFYNNLVLERQYPQPQQVIIVWPGADRLTEFTNQGACCHGSWSCDETEIGELINWGYVYTTINAKSENRAHVLRMYSSALQSIWGGRLSEFTWAIETVDHIGCELLSTDSSSWDWARDLVHPGQRHQRSWAQQIAESLR
jgi:hypothetical protein